MSNNMLAMTNTYEKYRPLDIGDNKESVKNVITGFYFIISREKKKNSLSYNTQWHKYVSIK